MSQKMCSIDGCDGPVKSRGWCVLHYNRWLTHGDPLKTLGPAGNRRRGTCKAEGCAEPHEARGLCLAHYNAWRRANKVGVKPPCQIDGCNLPSKSRRFCNGHYARWVQYGDPLAGAANKVVPIGVSLSAAPLLAEIAKHGGTAEALDACGIRVRRERERLDKAIKRARQAGCLDAAVADDLACRMFGVHPALIWGEDWWDHEAMQEVA